MIYLLPLFHRTLQFPISTVVGTGGYGNSGDNGPAVNAQVNSLGVLVCDNNGNLFVSDAGNNAIRFINKQTGIIKTIAGMINGTNGFSGDGLQATSATLHFPTGLSLDPSNNLLYIADTNNHRIRKVTLSSGIITTYVGTGNNGYNGDGNLAINAQLDTPYGVTADKSNNIYIADTTNHAIRKVNSVGIITTFVGSGTSASIYANLVTPNMVLMDGSGGNLFITDYGNNNVRKVTISEGSGMITTVAGSSMGLYGYSGDGDLAVNAELNMPTGLALDFYGNLFIADRGNHVVRLVAYDTGIITTYAGGGMSMGDGASATSAYLVGPAGLAVDASGALYIADSGDYRIRKVVPGTWNFPTSQPSFQPVAHPTSQPTNHPSEMPTAQPSEQPTSHPSEEPSGQPSSTPSSQPSQMPVPRPSSHPSEQPTSHPSEEPSAQPSLQPVAHPSRQPKAFPTNQPVAHPTLQPKAHPTSQPTDHPSEAPSGQPSFVPSSQPSQMPVPRPSSRPSEQPTSHPSEAPTSQPSSQPLSIPSGQPSHNPQSIPTGQPSRQPTTYPSEEPSSQPSAQPSTRPLPKPSGQPSKQPTMQPSGFPTKQPSGQPSEQPSAQPSNRPNVRPSSQPSGQPSDQPSKVPSMHPSSQPSEQPTTQPTTKPLKRPTSQPSRQPSSQPSSQPSRRPLR